jgi:hypothetical protein
MLFLIMLFLIHGFEHPYQVRMATLRSKEEEEEGDKTIVVG